VTIGILVDKRRLEEGKSSEISKQRHEAPNIEEALAQVEAELRESIE
jgi:hypothetical protein